MATNFLAYQDKARLLQLLVEGLVQDKQQAQAPRFRQHSEALEPWYKAMATGTLIGKPYSNSCLKSYYRNASKVLSLYGEISFDALRQALENTPPEQFGKRNDIYRAVLSLGKFLIRENSLDESFLKQVKEIKPRRHIPPKRTSVNEKQLENVIQACKTQHEKLIISLLSSTGLRASECCALRIQDIDLENKSLVVENGKGGKRRRVGLNDEVRHLLKVHILGLREKEPESPVFINNLGVQMDRFGLLNRIRAIGGRINLKISPHALRRCFVTINANRGRSLVILQMACGHSDIKTTRMYCQTSEEEVINAMQGW